ncbi:unnamed protein product, partial [Ectocarpus sp. 12 AP-2014]
GPHGIFRGHSRREGGHARGGRGGAAGHRRGRLLQGDPADAQLLLHVLGPHQDQGQGSAQLQARAVLGGSPGPLDPVVALLRLVPPQVAKDTQLLPLVAALCRVYVVWGGVVLFFECFSSLSVGGIPRHGDCLL